MIDLKPFCSTDESRTQIHYPFSVGQWTYATDGRVIVRVPRIADVAESYPVVAGSIEKLGDWSQSDANTVEFASLRGKPLPPVKQAVCEDCDGYGHVHLTGKTTITPCNYDHPDAFLCENCDGEGYTNPSHAVPIGANYISNIYLLKIKALPNPRISIADAKTGESTWRAVPFIFDGGCGYVMPMRWPQ